jgi:hypothetical protein
MILADKLRKLRAKNELTMSEDSRLQGPALTVAATSPRGIYRAWNFVKD